MRGIHQSLVVPLTKDQWCGKCIILIEIIQEFIPGEQAIFLMVYFIDAYAWLDFKELHQPRLWFITGGYLVKRWFIPAAARARGQSNDLNREILASNLFNCHKEVINAPPVPSISRCIHIVYRHKNVWEYQWSNFIYNCMSTFLQYVHCKDALLDCSAPGGERCESLTWVDEIHSLSSPSAMTIDSRFSG